ncbi:hypothetical protein ElyMa_000896800 [Elysia marginata]|uniref:THAP-type domain-containing protein n=1 Tax=Elysia marginata TaxID=1093978 RepID=A0AAV4H7F8_9GAST|nr:hypothetical protein ElyMa_000896800 [Elysia marginata]
MDTKYLSSILGVPNKPDYDSQMTWLFFFSKHTLNKWLVAFCRSIPAEILNETGVLQACHQHLKERRNESPPLALKNHTRLFFPSCDADLSAAVSAAAEVRINALPKRSRLGKKRPARPKKGSNKDPRKGRVGSCSNKWNMP